MPPYPMARTWAGALCAIIALVLGILGILSIAPASPIIMFGCVILLALAALL